MNMLRLSRLSAINVHSYTKPTGMRTEISALVLFLFGVILWLGIPISAHSFDGLLNCGDPALARGEYCFNDGSRIGGSVCQSFVGGCPEGETCLDTVICPIPQCATAGLDLEDEEPCADESGWICAYSIFDPATGYCTSDPFGGELGIPRDPSCEDSSLLEGTLCLNEEGKLCSSTGEGSGQYCQGEYSCSGPEQIVQNCIAAPTTFYPNPLLKRATDAAVQSVLETHALPSEDEALVRRHARPSLRAHLYAELLEIANKPDADRDYEEQMVIWNYEDQIRELRVRQARAAEQEYYEYASDYCSYTPPEGYSFDTPTDCATPFGALFGTPAHPSLEEFQAYGYSQVMKRDLVDDPEASRLAQETSRSLIFYASVAVAGLLAFGAFVWLSLTVSYVATSIVAFIFPYGLFGTSLVAGAAAPVFFILLAIIGSVFAVLQYDEYDKFVKNVTSLVEDAQDATKLPIDLRCIGTPDSAECVPGLPGSPTTPLEEYYDEYYKTQQTAANRRLQSDLFHVFIKSTQPEFDAPPPPAPTSSDPRFVLMDEAGNVLEVVSTINLALSDPDDPGSTPAGDTFSVRLHGGWFVPTWTTPSQGSSAEKSILSLSVDYIGWDGEPAVIWRKGTQFLIPGEASNGTGSDPQEPNSASDVISDAQETDVLKFIDADGNKRQASILLDTTPPTITPVVSGQTINNSGWYVSTVDLSWSIDDPESEVTSTEGCNTLAITTDGQFVESCTATSAGGTASEVIIIRRDTQPPSISPVVSPPSNVNGWNNTDVVVSYACEDPSPGSGVASCPGPEMLTQEGLHVVPAKTANDVAGNSQFGGSLTVSIDKTPPQVSIQVPENGAVYVVNQTVTASWSATDDLSGIATASATSPNGSLVDTTAIGGFLFAVDASDRADNTIQVTHSYTVITAEEATRLLSDQVDGLNTGRGIRKALISKLGNAVRSLTNDRNKAAINKLKAFIRQVEALVGKKISPEDADRLITQARTIIESVK